MPLDDRSHHGCRIGEKLCFCWELFRRPPFEDLLGDLIVSDGESSGGRFHTDSSSKSSRCPYLLWTFVNFPSSCGGPLECWLFEDLLRIFCIVEHGEETEVFTVFEVVAVWEEVDFFVDGVIIFSFGLTVSRVGFSVSSIQVNIVFLCRWIIRCRDESACLRVWNVFFLIWSFGFLFLWENIDNL